MRFLVSHPAAAIARQGLQLLLRPQDQEECAHRRRGITGYTAFLGTTQQQCAIFQEKGVWEKGNQSHYLALSLIFYPQPADTLELPSAR